MTWWHLYADKENLRCLGGTYTYTHTKKKEKFSDDLVAYSLTNRCVVMSNSGPTAPAAHRLPPPPMAEGAGSVPEEDVGGLLATA
jgi:hypothetical protein